MKKQILKYNLKLKKQFQKELQKRNLKYQIVLIMKNKMKKCYKILKKKSLNNNNSLKWKIILKE